ncbi:Protein MRPL-4 [Aphelenchoides avenae]|nr:Protein MRPL-4 [Aphelenchus avenae]
MLTRRAIQRVHSFCTTSALQEQRALWRADERNPYVETPEAWVTSLCEQQERLSIVRLHPDVFRVPPRIDLLHRNIVWQQVYRNLQLTKTLSRAELPGGGKKPWPQKKTGRHHAGSIRAPGFVRGGFAHGVRGPRTWFYVLPDAIRLKGLCTALTIKHTQDDLVVVDDFSSLPTSDPQVGGGLCLHYRLWWFLYLHDLAEERNWGYSALFVDAKADDVSPNLVAATEKIPSFTVMPVYGLNCYSILKHDTLVLSRRALEALEAAILRQVHRTDSLQRKYRYMDYKQKLLAEGQHEEDPTFSPFV